MNSVRGRPLHPPTQRKMERDHRSMKNFVKLDNCYSSGQSEQKLQEFVHYYNYQRNHKVLLNLTPSAGYFGQAHRKIK